MPVEVELDRRVRVDSVMNNYYELDDKVDNVITNNNTNDGREEESETEKVVVVLRVCTPIMLGKIITARLQLSKGLWRNFGPWEGNTAMVIYCLNCQCRKYHYICLVTMMLSSFIAFIAWYFPPSVDISCYTHPPGIVWDGTICCKDHHIYKRAHLI
jgi:hypothetical protein